VLFSGSVPSGVGIVGSPPAKTEDVGGAVPPSSSVVPFSASSYPQPKMDSGLVLANFQPLPETALGLVASLVSAGKASVVSGEAVTVWAGLDSPGAFPDGVMPSAVLPIPIFSPQSPPEDSLVAVPFTHTSLEFSELGQRSCMELDLFLEEEPIPLSCCPADKFRGSLGSGIQIGFCIWFRSSIIWWGFCAMVSKDGFRPCLRIL